MKDTEKFLSSKQEKAEINAGYLLEKSGSCDKLTESRCGSLDPEKGFDAVRRKPE